MSRLLRPHVVFSGSYRLDIHQACVQRTSYDTGRCVRLHIQTRRFSNISATGDVRRSRHRINPVSLRSCPQRQKWTSPSSLRPTGRADPDSWAQEDDHADDTGPTAYLESSHPSPQPALRAYVPFEGAQDALQESLAHAPSLTNTERQIFNRLQRMGISRQKPEDERVQPLQLRTERHAPSALDAVLDMALQDRAAATQRTMNEERSMRARARLALAHPAPSSTTEQEPKADADLQKTELARLKHAIKLAPTDAAAWKILNNDVIDPVIALNLDKTEYNPAEHRPGSTSSTITPPTTTTSSSSSSSSSPSTSSSTMTWPGPNGKWHLDVVGPNMLQLLTHTTKVLTTHYPTTQYIPAIIPLLKSSGASAFALGASTRLYNLILQHSWTHDADLPALAELLTDMERQVILSDHTTVDILQSVVERVRAISRDDAAGPVVRQLWGSGRYERAFREIKSSLERMRVREVERARAAEAAGLEDRGGFEFEDDEAVE